MGKVIDLTNKKIGHLLILEFAYTKNKLRYWKCKCDCGQICYVSTKLLRNGATKSCGCLRINSLKRRVTKHNLRNTRIYRIWQNIKKRCSKPKNPIYKYYGGRGIIICNEWENDFVNFYNWAINNGYKEKLTIDRINVNGNYEPTNCRWVDIKTQQRNKRNNHLITYNGETHCISEWAEIIKIPSKTLEKRFLDNWNIERALTTPLMH